MQIKFSRQFTKRFDRAPEKVKLAFEKRLKLFIEDKYYPLVNNHSLGGKWKDYRSISITGDWRAIFRELDDGQIIFFIIIGTHSELYG